MSTMEATVLMPLTPDLTAEGGRFHLRETLSLMRVLEGRDASLTLGDLLYLEDSDGDTGHTKRRGSEDEAAAELSISTNSPSMVPARSWSRRPSTIDVRGSIG